MLKSPFLTVLLSPPSSPWAFNPEREGGGFLTTAQDHRCPSLGRGEDKPMRNKLHEHPLPCLREARDLPLLLILELDHPTNVLRHVGSETATPWAEGRLSLLSHVKIPASAGCSRRDPKGLKVSHHIANYVLSLSVSQGVRVGLTSHWGLKQ